MKKFIPWQKSEEIIDNSDEKAKRAIREMVTIGCTGCNSIINDEALKSLSCAG